VVAGRPALVGRPSDTRFPRCLGSGSRRCSGALRGASIVSKLPTSHTRHVIGAALTFRLNVAARVVFTVEAKRTGVRRGQRCVVGRAPGRKRCTRFVPVRGSFTVAGAAGANRALFSGRIGGRALAPGAYRLLARPTSGAVAAVAFTIVRR
jgi:hypothetical protein